MPYPPSITLTLLPLLHALPAVQAGGTTLCKLAQLNMVADSPKLPFRSDWDTNCVPFEAFLGPHPAVGSSAAAARALLQARRTPPLGDEGGDSGAAAPAAAAAATIDGAPANPQHAVSSSTSTGSPAGRRLSAFWLGGACWLGFLTPPQLKALPQHYAPLTFVASEGPLPEALPLENPRLAMVTMLRRPADRALSSFHWWRYMLEAMPQAPGGLGYGAGGVNGAGDTHSYGHYKLKGMWFRHLPAADEQNALSYCLQPSVMLTAPRPTLLWRSGSGNILTTGRWEENLMWCSSRQRSACCASQTAICCHRAHLFPSL